MVDRGRRQDVSLIDKVGWPCLWYPNVLLPEERYDGTTDYTSTQTDSRGYVEEPPEEIVMMFLGHSGDVEFDMSGAWEKGTARGTVEANIYLGTQERIIPQAHSFPYKLQMVRSGGRDDTLTTPWLDEILILRDKDRKYANGTDFELRNDANTGISTIHWIDGGFSPAPGVKYAVKAMIFPVWRVKNVPKVRAISSKDQLPWQVELIRDDVAVRGGV